MIEIRIVNELSDLSGTCHIISISQREQTKKTGVLYNTNGLTAVQLKNELDEKHGICLCAYDETKLIGTLSVFPEEKQNWYSACLNDKIIKYVAVDPNYQGKHIATKMIEYVKNSIPFDVLSVSTGEKNRNAIRLYESCGFILMHISRGPINDAYKYAFWKNECPVSNRSIWLHLTSSRIRCVLKKMFSKLMVPYV